MRRETNPCAREPFQSCCKLTQYKTEPPGWAHERVLSQQLAVLGEAGGSVVNALKPRTVGYPPQSGKDRHSLCSEERGDFGFGLAGRAMPLEGPAALRRTDEARHKQSRQVADVTVSQISVSRAAEQIRKRRLMNGPKEFRDIRNKARTKR
jgi:hypothetical protein